MKLIHEDEEMNMSLEAFTAVFQGLLSCDAV
jgi:hypothetical protein